MNVSALRQLYSLVSSIPANEFCLNLFYMKNGDYVQGCGLGYAARFNLCGLQIENAWQLPEVKDRVTGVTYRGMPAASYAFGVTNQEALALFSGAGRSKYDNAADINWSAVSTHKQLWMHRMEQFFVEKGLQPEDAEAIFEDQPKLIAYVFDDTNLTFGDA